MPEPRAGSAILCKCTYADDICPYRRTDGSRICEDVVRDEPAPYDELSEDDVLALQVENSELRRLVAIADRMFAENHAKEQAKSDAEYLKEFGHKGPHLAGALGSAGREYTYHRHRIGRAYGLPNAMGALGQRGGEDRVGADVYERELERALRL